MARSTRWSPFRRRIVLYGAAASAGFALIWAGFLRTEPPGIDERLEAMFVLTRDNRFEEARRLVAAIREDEGEHVKLRLAEAFIDEREGRLEAAQAVYTELAETVPGDAQKLDLLLSAADIERRLGRADEAGRRLAELTARFGENSRARQLRIALLVDAGRITDALSEIRVLAEEDPGYPHAARLRRQLERLVEGVPPAVPPSQASTTEGR